MVSVDVNHRSRLWDASIGRAALRALVTSADLVFATEEEAELVVWSDVTGSSPIDRAAELAQALAALGPDTVVVKLGAGGALRVDTGKPFSLPPLPWSSLTPWALATHSSAPT
jgi:2-dehydro-3-deoxygluconokinase